MTDIFSKEGIQTNDINPTPPVVNAVNSQGQPTAKPTGKINYDAVASSLGNMQDNFKPDATPSSVPMALPDAAAAPDMAPAQPDAASAPVIAPELPASAPKDLFALEQIQPPSVAEQNNNALSSGANLQNPSTPEDHAAKAFVDQDHAQAFELAKTRFTPEQLASFKNNPITTGEVGRFLDWNQVTTGGMIDQGYEAMQNLSIAKKIKNGEEISPAEKTQFYDMIDKQLEMKLRGFSGWGGIAYYGAQIPAWAAEFALTGGIGKAVEQATVSAATRIGINSAVASASGLAVNAATRLPSYYAGNYGEIRLNDYTALTDKGVMTFNEGEHSPAIAALKAFGYTEASALGQEMAPAIGKGLELVGAKLSTPISAAVNQLSPEIRQALYEAYKVIQPTAQMSKVFSAVGWKGMLEQLGANRVSQVLHATTNLSTEKDYTWHDYLSEITPNVEQMKIEGGLLAIAGGVSAATSLATNIMTSKGMPAAKAAETVQNMSAVEKENFVNQNIEAPKSAYPEFKAPSGEKTVYAMAMDNDSKASSISGRQLEASAASDPPPINEEQSGFNAAWEKTKKFWNDEFVPQVFNDMHSIQTLSAKAREAGAEIPVNADVRFLAREARENAEFIKYNIQKATLSADETGFYKETGKGMKPILDDFDNMFLKTEPDQAVRHDDLNKYEQAQRFLYEAQKGDAYVSAEQFKRSVDHLQKVREKYGADSSFFDTFAQERRDWRNRILHNLVESGLKTQAWFDETTKENPFYTPLNRVVDEEGFAPMVTSKGTGKDPNANRIGSMKQFKGSDLGIKNTVESDMRNASLIIHKSRVNRMLKNIARWKEFYPEDVKVSNPRIIAKEVKVLYDPNLRAKLEATIAHFGGKLDRRAEVKLGKNGKGKDAGGYYSPSENLIALKLGAGEGALTHEVGHLLDEQLGLGSFMLKDPEMKAELQKLSEDRLMGGNTLEGEDALHFKEELEKQGSAQYKEYIKSDPEVIANFFDAYVNSPEQVDKVAPKAKAVFEKFIDADPKLAFIKEIKPSTTYAEEVIQKVIRDLDGKEGSFPFYENGSRKFLEVSDSIKKGLEGLRPDERDMTWKYIKKPAMAAKRVLQTGATALPPFAIRHYLRNIELAYLNSDGKATPLDVIKGTFDVLGHSEEYQKWMAVSGGFRNFLDLSDENLNKSYVDMFKKPSKFQAFNPLKWHEKMKELADQPARLAVYKALKRDGMSEMEAAFASIDQLIDYNSGGSISKSVNKYAAFFNTRIKHLETSVRSFAKNPAGFALRATATITIPQLLLTGYYLYAADDKTRQEYLDIPVWRRAIAMNIKIGNQWVPLPRAFLPAEIFGAIPEEIAIHLYKGYRPEARNAWLSMVAGLAEGAAPVSDWSAVFPAPIKAAIENQINYNFFLDRHIYSPFMDKLPPSQRSNTYTSETAKALGDIFNFSPAEIDNTVTDISGNLGRAMMQLGDKGIAIAKGVQGKPVSQKPTDIVDNPLIGGLLERNPSGSSSESAQEFYNHFEEVSQMHAALNNLEGKDLSKFQRENRTELSQYDALSFAHKEISQLQKRSRQIYEDTHMTSDQKAGEIQNLNDQISKIARQANIHYNKSVGEK